MSDWIIDTPATIEQNGKKHIECVICGTVINLSLIHIYQVIYPEIPVSERHNFVITDNELGYGTPSEKSAANIAAIQTLKQDVYKRQHLDRMKKLHEQKQ